MLYPPPAITAYCCLPGPAAGRLHGAAFSTAALPPGTRSVRPPAAAPHCDACGHTLAPAT